MDLSIIIVAWNVRDLLEKCLASIYTETRGISFEVFVIDNASKDRTSKMVEEKFPTVKLYSNKENKGFAAANNQGIRMSKGSYVLLLNPDTVIFRNTLADSVNFMDRHRECGIAGIHMLNPNYTHQDSVRRFPSISDQAIIFLKLHLLFPNLKQLRRYLAHDFDYLIDEYGDSRGEKSYAEADQVMGAFFLVRRDVFEKIGLLDEKFFLWMEEVDFCKRAWNAGYKIYYTREANVLHHYGSSFRQIISARRQLIFGHSMRRYFFKHKPFFEYMILALAAWIGALLAFTIQLLKVKEKKNITKSYIKREKEYI